MAIRNYTSEQSPAKTAGEIKALLAENGAHRMSLDCEGGRWIAVTFLVEVRGRARVREIQESQLVDR